MNTSAEKDRTPDWIDGLRKPSAYPHGVDEIRLIETHISWVFLTGEFVYKIKKPVDLGFVDFSTLERRKFFCEEEIRLNRRTTPHLYLGVEPIGLREDRPVIGERPAIEYAVRMRQFPPSDRLDRMLDHDRLDVNVMQRAGGTLARFHSGLESRDGMDPEAAAADTVGPALDNFSHLQGAHISSASRARIARVEAWTREQAEVLAPVFRQRAADGFIRECHGDLHLANLFMHEGEIYPFDSLEFNPGLRWIDQASDISFLVMDLMARNRDDLAYAVLNSWLEETGDYQALTVLRFYLVYRCMVRLKVASIQVQQLHEDALGEHAIKARHYLGLTLKLMAPPTEPRLVLMHGFSGSGKTFISDQLVTALPAIRVRSDLERKRLHGVPRDRHAGSSVGTGLYARNASDRTYEVLLDHCRAGLEAGFNMIADATFLERARRKPFLDLAAGVGTRATILSCEAPTEVLRERIRRRAASGRDESDADEAVLEHQLDQYDPLTADEQAIEVKDAGALARRSGQDSNR